SGAGGAAAGIAERRGAVRVGRGRACGPSRSVAEGLGAIAVSGDGADGPSAGVTERSLVLCRRCRDHGERECGDGECLHGSFSLPRGSAARPAPLRMPAAYFLRCARKVLNDCSSPPWWLAAG